MTGRGNGCDSVCITYCWCYTEKSQTPGNAEEHTAGAVDSLKLGAAWHWAAVLKGQWRCGPGGAMHSLLTMARKLFTSTFTYSACHTCAHECSCVPGSSLQASVTGCKCNCKCTQCTLCAGAVSMSVQWASESGQRSLPAGAALADVHNALSTGMRINSNCYACSRSAVAPVAL